MRTIVFLLQLRQEALLLLAKVHYARGQYQEALSCFDQMDLEKVKIDYISSRKLKLIAEGFAIKGKTSKSTLGGRCIIMIYLNHHSLPISMQNLFTRIYGNNQKPHFGFLACIYKWARLNQKC